jgi:hypothetical protein
MKKKVNWKTLILGTIIFWIGFIFWYRELNLFHYPNIYIDVLFTFIGYALMFLGIGIILKDAPD